MAIGRSPNTNSCARFKELQRMAIWVANEDSPPPRLALGEGVPSTFQRRLEGLDAPEGEARVPVLTAVGRPPGGRVWVGQLHEVNHG